ncbi:MAG: hypothetical protein MR471_07140 [Clostridia bacterium]|nr:hypothetical protein [Clostridia bacterium]
MKNWKKTVAVFLLIICPIVIFALVSFISGKAISQYVGFAVDSSERLYVGTNAGIEVYENGVKVKTIEPPSSRSYVFTIEDEKIVSSVGDAICIFSLDGELLERYEDSFDNFLKMKSNSTGFVSPSGKEYGSKNTLGYHKIMQGDKCVYAMPLFSYIVNVLFVACIICILSFVIVMVIKMYRSRKGIK